MRRIRKGPEPTALRDYRLSTPGRSYRGFQARGPIREQLCRDQGYLCAYCMARIAELDSTMGIEHWIAQSAPDGAAHALEWSNMLGVCAGIERHPAPVRRVGTSDPRHCDKAREGGAAPLRVHPVTHPTDPQTLFRYTQDGRIDSDDADARHDIEVLNLRNWRLCQNRAAVLDVFRRTTQRPFIAPEGALRRLYRHATVPDANGRLPEYAGMLEYFATRWMRQRGIAP